MIKAEVVEKVKKLIEEHKTYKEIGFELKINYASVVYICHKLGYHARYDRKLKPEVYTAILNNSRQDAAKILGISAQSVSHKAIKYQIPLKKKKNELYKQIEAEIQEGKLSQSEISRKYNVSRQYVSQIKMDGKNE